MYVNVIHAYLVINISLSLGSTSRSSYSSPLYHGPMSSNQIPCHRASCPGATISTSSTWSKTGSSAKNALLISIPRSLAWVKLDRFENEEVDDLDLLPYPYPYPRPCRCKGICRGEVCRGEECCDPMEWMGWMGCFGDTSPDGYGFGWMTFRVCFILARAWSRVGRARFDRYCGSSGEVGLGRQYEPSGLVWGVGTGTCWSALHSF